VLLCASLLSCDLTWRGITLATDKSSYATEEITELMRAGATPIDVTFAVLSYPEPIRSTRG
jgi:hypothetical protein